MNVDVLAIGAHPDDVEMTVGGTLAKMTDRGHSLAICDLTRGEMGSNGTPEQRAEEAAQAAKVLGAAERTNLDLGDGTLANTLDNRTKVIELIRRLRPTIVLANYWEDLHPDHAAAGNIVRDTMYPSGLVNFPAEGEPHRPKEVLFYMSHLAFEPSFIVDVSEHHEKKLEAIYCYRSQLSVERGGEKVPTRTTAPEFVSLLEGRARYFGGLIQRPFGEPLLTRCPVPMDDPVEHYEIW